MRSDKVDRARQHARRAAKHLEGDLAALEAANARVQAQLAAAQNGTRAGRRRARSAPARAGMVWPVNGPIVSPVRHALGPPARRRRHRGARRHADPRRAVGQRDPACGWTGGYGNYTCVGHGGGLSTCYAHQSSYATSNGASVSQGQVIGSVGCTGHCFGDHLHFEVRVGGAPVNPAGYL